MFIVIGRQSDYENVMYLSKAKTRKAAEKDFVRELREGADLDPNEKLEHYIEFIIELKSLADYRIHAAPDGDHKPFWAQAW